jgi:uncharacterized protein (TIGR00251 family)
MNLKVKVNAGAQSESVKQLADGSYQVRTRSPATKGKANRRVRELLAEHFGLHPDQVEIVSGQTSQIKRVRLR